MTKALSLVSGGLDSILAALIVKQQKACPEHGRRIKVTGLTFQSLFFDPKNAKKVCKQIKIPLKIIDFSKKHLQIVKNPPHGYGKNANPCIDCHLLMLQQAKKIMIKQKYDFIITGEVLGQRPFSQNKNSLALIEKKASLKGLILRPLSAKLLSPTIPEQKNWIDREKLLDISGRSRKKQLELAKKFKIKNYSAPGTSCILTDPQFSKRFFNLLKINPKTKANDIKLLKLGRHFWQNKDLIIVGRDHEENIKLKKLAQKKDILIEPKTFPGPTVLIRPYTKTPSVGVDPCVDPFFKKLLLKYSPHAPKKISQNMVSLKYAKTQNQVRLGQKFFPDI